MRDRFPLLLCGGLFMLGALVVFLTRGAERGSFADTLSTHRSEPDGARGLYLFLEQSKVPVARVQTSLDLIDPKKNLVLLAVELEEDLDVSAEVLNDKKKADKTKDEEEDDEAEKLHRGANIRTARALSKDEREAVLKHIRNGATVVYVPWSERANPLLKALDVGLWRAERGLGPRTLVPPQPTPFTLGVERVEANVRAWVDLPAGATPLLIDERFNQTVAGLVPYGQGQLIVIGAPHLAMNSNLAKADNAQFWRSLAKAVAQTGKLGFDEYHHGFTAERSMAEFAANYGLHAAVLQLLLGVAFWSLALKRFGRPRHLLVGQRVGSTDALFATSRLYREGRHHAHAAQAVAQALTLELAAKAGASARAKPHEIMEALKARGMETHATALERLLHLAAHAHTESQVLEVAQLATATRQTFQKKKTVPLPLTAMKKA